MDEQTHNQRLLMAAVLCFGVMAIWGILFPPPKPPPETTPDSALVDTATGAPSLAAAQPELLAKTPTVARPKVDPAFHDFDGKVAMSEGVAPVPWRMTLTNVGGGIERFELPSYKERDAQNQPTPDPIALVFPAAAQKELDAQMAGLRLGEGSSFELAPDAVYEVVETTASSVRYRYRTREGVVIEREYHVDPSSFQLEMAVTVRNSSAQPQHYSLGIQAAQKRTGATDAGGFLFMPPPDHLNAACYTDDSVERELQKELVEDPESYDDAVRWVGMDRQYFLSAIVQRDGVEARCRLAGKDKLATALLELPKVELTPGQEKRHKFTAYLGVKKPEQLTKVDAQLEAAVDYTIIGLDLALLCEALLAILALIHGYSGSWGVAILGLTVLVKLLLFPLNQRSGQSMRAMASLKPEIDKLKEKYPEDQRRQSEELMGLYREHGVNPASGCVPILLQMPIWFALYRALWVSVDLYQEPFMWMPDLTARDPFFALPVMLVFVMFVQQKLTPNTMDPAQQKILLYFMPLMFGFMMAALPAGLCFYILVNSLLTIAQQHLINRSMGPLAGSPEQSGPPAAAS